MLARRDAAIREREERLLAAPGDPKALRDLVGALHLHQPAASGLGPYSDCQRALSEKFGKARRTEGFLGPGKIGPLYRGLDSILGSKCYLPHFPVTQIYFGQQGTVNGEARNCTQRMSLFKTEGVISRICHDCYKVQVLPGSVEALMQVYFIFREIELPQDNMRKTMVEFREHVSYPYKGYIYCEFEDEAVECMEILQSLLRTHDVSDVHCRLSHGCSEYGVKYAAFKYAPDGAHRAFPRPESWGSKEAEFWSENDVRPTMPFRMSREGVSLKELVCFRTWIDYAEIIGDESTRAFRDMPDANKPPRFAGAVMEQANRRNSEMRELRDLLTAQP